jgi:hypothetical protein
MPLKFLHTFKNGSRGFLLFCNRHSLHIAIGALCTACGCFAILSFVYYGQDRTDLWTAGGAIATFAAATVALWIGTEQQRAKREEDVRNARVVAAGTTIILSRLIDHLDLLGEYLVDCEDMLSDERVAENGDYIERLRAVLSHLREPISIEEIRLLAVLSLETAHSIAIVRSLTKILYAEILMGIDRAIANHAKGKGYMPDGCQWREWTKTASAAVESAWLTCKDIDRSAVRGLSL